MEDNLQRAKDYAMTIDRKMAGKEAKKKALIEQQRLRLEDLEEREALDNASLLGGNSDDDSDDRAYRQTDADETKVLRQEGKDVESSGESDDDLETG